MKEVSVYAQIYKGDLTGVSKTSIDLFLSKMSMLKKGYEGGLSLSVIAKQMDLTVDEAENFFNNMEREVKRIKQYKFRCAEDEGISDKQIINHMLEKEEKIVVRILDGELLGSICEEFGIVYRKRVANKFKRMMTKKGYAVKKFAQHYRILKDISRGMELDEIVDKYEGQFSSGDDVDEYINKHQCLYKVG